MLHGWGQGWEAGWGRALGAAGGRRRPHEGTVPMSTGRGNPCGAAQAVWDGGKKLSHAACMLLRGGSGVPGTVAAANPTRLQPLGGAVLPFSSQEAASGQELQKPRIASCWAPPPSGGRAAAARRAAGLSRKHAHLSWRSRLER